jgi:hypothetical protein
MMNSRSANHTTKVLLASVTAANISALGPSYLFATDPASQMSEISTRPRSDF